MTEQTPATPPAPTSTELAREYRPAILAGDTNAAFVYLRRRLDETDWATSTAGRAVQLMLDQEAGAVPDTRHRDTANPEETR